MTIPVIYKWRVMLACGCTWRIEGDPDLAKPLICPREYNGQAHGLRMITKAERL